MNEEQKEIQKKKEKGEKPGFFGNLFGGERERPTYEYEREERFVPDEVLIDEEIRDIVEDEAFMETLTKQDDPLMEFEKLQKLWEASMEDFEP